MNLEINGLTENLFVDIILLWAFVSIIICFGLLMFGILFIDNGILTINDNNIIDKIIKLKNDDKHLYKFTKKLDKHNIEFLNKYIKRFDKIIYLSKFTEVRKEFINDNDKRLYKKIESIIYYYNLITEK